LAFRRCVTALMADTRELDNVAASFLCDLAHQADERR